MITTIATLKFKPGRAAAFEAFFATAAADVAATEPGISVYKLCRSADKADTYVIVEFYADQAALDAHLAKMQGSGAAEAINDLLDGPMQFEIYADI